MVGIIYVVGTYCGGLLPLHKELHSPKSLQQKILDANREPLDPADKVFALSLCSCH